MKTLKDLKVGDTAYDLIRGEVTVVGIDTSDDYPIKITVINNDNNNGSYSYTFEGKLMESHKNPLLYLTNPFQQQGKWMMVSDRPIDENDKGVKRFVFAKKEGYFIAWEKASNDDEVAKAIYTNTWKYTKKIVEETIPEYTMEELVAKLGNFKIKK
jgi:hypothetical protein